MKKKSTHPVIIMLFIVCIIITGCGSSNNDNSGNITESVSVPEQKAQKPATQISEEDSSSYASEGLTTVTDSSIPGFAFDVLGRTYADLNQEFGPFSDPTSYEGVNCYRTADEKTFGFPVHGGQEDADNYEGDLCISYIGKLSEIFNVPDDISLQELADRLGIEFDEESLPYAGDHMNDAVIWEFSYDNKNYKTILNYDENFKATVVSLQSM